MVCWFVGVLYWVAKFYLMPSALQKLRNTCVASFEVVVSVRKFERLIVWSAHAGRPRVLLENGAL